VGGGGFKGDQGMEITEPDQYTARVSNQGENMTDRVRIRLRCADREIEVEGTRSDLDELVAKWWRAESSDAGSNTDRSDGSPGTQSPSRPRGKQSSKASNPTDEADAIALSIARRIKTHDQFELFESKVLHNNDRKRLVQLVSWIGGEPLTSGDIARVLQELQVKIDLSGVSKVLKRDANEYITDGRRSRGKTTRYSLSARASKDFQTWLGTDA